MARKVLESLEARCSCGAALAVHVTGKAGVAKTRCSSCKQRWAYSMWVIHSDADKTMRMFEAFPVDAKGNFISK